MQTYKKTTIDLSNYRDLFEHSQDGIYFSTLEGEILEVNSAFSEITGYSCNELMEINSKKLYVNPEIRGKFQKEILKHEIVNDFEVELFRKNGSKIICLLTSSLFKSKNQKILGFKGIVRDITMLKVATAALRISEKRFRVLFHGSPDSVFVEDFKGNILDANPAACDLHDMLYTEMVGKNVFELMPKKMRHKAKIDFDKMISGDIKTIESISYSKEKNKEIPVEINVSCIKYLDQPALLLHVRDITKRKKAEKNLLEARRKRLFEITDVQELEKKRISRELHDGVGQMLFGAKMHLESLRRKVAGQVKIESTVNEIEQELKAIISEVRDISKRLRPNVLDDFGLVPALEQLFSQYQNSTEVELLSNLTSIRFDPRTEVAIYRIVQEAISNSVRHGKATTIWINLAKVKRGTELIIRDNGVGFQIDETQEGHGLKNMKERAEITKGQLDISSVKSRGTVIKVIIPKT